MLTEYDIQRLSAAIVDNLVNNEGFMKRVARMMPKRKKMVSSSAAAEILGISRKTVCCIAEQLGGVRACSTDHWTFPEDELVENYRQYKTEKK